MLVQSNMGKGKYLSATFTVTVPAAGSTTKPTTPSEPEQPSEPEFVPETATVDEVNKIMSGEDTDTTLVDARPQEAYAGWALRGIKNGGHLKGAVLYSARWFALGSKKLDSQLEAYNKAIGLNADKSYIVYDAGDFGPQKDAAATVAKYFYKQGVKNVKIFNAKDIINEGKDLESYKNYQRFLPTEIVKDISDYQTGKDTTLDPETLAVFSEDEIKNKVKLFDVSYGNVHESGYLTDGHVPGAVHINTNVYERPRSYVPEKREKYSIEYSLIPLEEFRDSVCPQYGITKDSIVIVASSDGRPISRIGYMLRSLGVKYYGMTGNYSVWNYNGYSLEKDKVIKPTSVDSFGSSDIPHPEEIVWMDEVKSILKANNYDSKNHTAGTILGENRTKSTYSYHDMMGKIEGTMEQPKEGQIYKNPDNTPAMKEVIEKYFKDNDIPTDNMKQPIILFCGDGWGASYNAYMCQAVDLNYVKYWGEGWVVWTDQGNWFIDYKGRKVRYDKYLDEVVDEDGNAINDPLVFKAE